MRRPWQSHAAHTSARPLHGPRRGSCPLSGISYHVASMHKTLHHTYVCPYSAPCAAIAVNELAPSSRPPPKGPVHTRCSPDVCKRPRAAFARCVQTQVHRWHRWLGSEARRTRELQSCSACRPSRSTRRVCWCGRGRVTMSCDTAHLHGYVVGHRAAGPRRYRVQSWHPRGQRVYEYRACGCILVMGRVATRRARSSQPNVAQAGAADRLCNV